MESYVYRLRISIEILQIQRYEGASTIYGPYTLSIYLKQYQELVMAAVFVSIHTYRIPSILCGTVS